MSVRWVIVLIVCCASVAHAQPSSPGPLVASHANLDDAAHCNACHVNGTRALSNVNCLSCHAALVQKNLHATPIVQGKQCWACHDDHEGRRFDDMGWRSIGGIAKLDHTLQGGWELEGAHQIGCDRCHTSKLPGGFTRYTGLSPACTSCHQAKSPHGATQLECDRCHASSAWKPAKAAMAFDHDRNTKLPLVGAHRAVACVKCHPQGNFVAASPACSSCHALQQPHASKLFDQRPCEWCHTPTYKTFKAYGFDHAEKTKFDLDTGHRIGCVKCHTTTLGAQVPTMRCEDCHTTLLQQHGKRFAAVPGGCAACHAPRARWTQVTRFDHRTTKFALTQQHADLQCSSCHRPIGPGKFEAFNGQIGCKECHAHAKVHADVDHPNGKFTTQQCLQCHTTQVDPRPNSVAIFHGPKSAFPLVKGHKNVPCADCHRDRTATGKTKFDGLSPECGDTCHDAGTVHDGKLGTKCSKCHVSGTWAALAFDHDKPFPDGRSFALVGDHRGASCDKCHGADKQFAGTPRRCGDAGCHASDDAHHGQLGKTCDRCHLANGDNRFNHNIMARFKLDGKHVTLPCADCHPSATGDSVAMTMKPRPRECEGCHPEPAVHLGEFGTWCERCHTTRNWDPR